MKKILLIALVLTSINTFAQEKYEHIENVWIGYSMNDKDIEKTKLLSMSIEDTTYSKLFSKAMDQISWTFEKEEKNLNEVKFYNKFYFYEDEECTISLNFTEEMNNKNYKNSSFYMSIFCENSLIITKKANEKSLIIGFNKLYERQEEKK